MDVTAGTVHATPGAPIIQRDISVVQDSGILGNTGQPSASRVLNPTAIALDNAAGTGAPFDKKDQVYNIFQRWPEKSTVINGALTAGSELLRISLNPMTLPPRLRDWVSFHQSCIPSIDVAIVIGGAAGTISWLALGWVNDDSKTVTLDDIQQVACEHINMNNTSVMRFQLNDNRKSGLYRSLPDDGEKYPAMVLLVNHPALNVQRNDDVNYPIDVYVRFSPSAKFFEPFNVIGTDNGGTGSVIDLEPFLQINPVDLVIGTSNVCNMELDTIDLPDSGWNSGQFIPSFTYTNIVSMRSSVSGNISDTVVVREGTTLDIAKIKSEVERLKDQRKGVPYPLPLEIFFGFGKVPKSMVGALWPQTAGIPAGGILGSVYNIQPYGVYVGDVYYEAIRLYAFQQGCIIHFKVKKYEVNPGAVNIMILYSKADPVRELIGKVMPFQHPDGKDSYIFYQKTTDPILSVAQGKGLNYTTSGISPNIDLVEGVNPDNKFYIFTYVQSGNQAATSSLPNGLKTISICRPGTTTILKDESGFWPITAPDIRGLRTMLEDIRAKLKTLWLAMDIEIAGQGIGTVAYAEGVMCIRTSTPRLIRTGVPTKIVARNIRAITNPSAIQSFPTGDFTPWYETTLAKKLGLPEAQRTTVPRFRNIPQQREAGLAAGLGLGATAGLFNGLYDFYGAYQRNQWMTEYQQRQIQMMKDLESMRGNNAQTLAQQQFENALSLKGFSAPSANNAQRINFASWGTQTDSTKTSSSGTNTDKPTPVSNMSTGTTTDLPDVVPTASSPNEEPKLPAPPSWTKGAVPTPFLQAGYEPRGQPQGPIDHEDISVPPPLEQTTLFRRDDPARQPMRIPQPVPPTPARTFSRPPPAPSSEVFNRADETRQAFRLKNNQPAPPVFIPPEERLIGSRSGNPSGESNFNRNAPERQAFRMNNSELDQRAFDHYMDFQPIDPPTFQRGGPGRTPVRQDPLTSRLCDLSGIPNLN